MTGTPLFPLTEQERYALQQKLLRCLTDLSAEEDDWRERSQDHAATVKVLKAEIKAITRQLRESQGGVH